MTETNFNPNDFMTYEPIISRLAIPPLFSDLNDEDAKKLVRDGILWEYHGWYCFTRKGFRQYIDSGTVEQDEIDESYQLTCHYCRYRGVVPTSFCAFIACFIRWFSLRWHRFRFCCWRLKFRLQVAWWRRPWHLRLECWYLRCLKYWYRLRNQFGSHPEDSISFSKKEKKMLYQAEKFQLIKLGIEEIPEYIRSLQEQSGQEVETISFHQTDLLDVVTPVDIVFRQRGEKSRGDAMIELARKVDLLADALNSAAIALGRATPPSE